MQDNDLKHTSKATKAFMEEIGINWCPNPPESPGLNSIECGMRWSIKLLRVSNHKPTRNWYRDCKSKSSASVHSGGSIETPGTCAFNIHSLSLSYHTRYPKLAPPTSPNKVISYVTSSRNTGYIRHMCDIDRVYIECMYIDCISRFDLIVTACVSVYRSLKQLITCMYIDLIVTACVSVYRSLKQLITCMYIVSLDLIWL